MSSKAFDLVHRVISAEPEEEASRIPFVDDPPEGETAPPKRRLKVEVAFFYVLLFIVFFMMGATLLSPNFFASLIGKKEATAPSPAPSGPSQGFTITKDGQKTEDATKDLSVKVSPSPAASLAASPAPVASESTAPAINQAAKIQILNGTNKTGAAAALQTKLSNRGIVVENIGNFSRRNIKRTTVYFDTAFKTAAQQVLQSSGGIMIESPGATEQYDVVVIIGVSH